MGLITLQSNTLLSDEEAYGCLLQLPWPRTLLPIDLGSLPMLADVAATSHVQVQPVAKLKYPHTQLIAPQSVWVVEFFSCHDLHVCFVRSVFPCILFLVCSLFPIVSQLTRSLVRQPCWNRHLHTPVCPHQWVWLTWFGSHHCLPYNLCQVYVSICSCSGFLPCLLTPLAIKKVLDLIALKEQAPCRTPLHTSFTVSRASVGHSHSPDTKLSGGWSWINPTLWA